MWETQTSILGANLVKKKREDLIQLAVKHYVMTGFHRASQPAVYSMQSIVVCCKGYVQLSCCLHPESKHCYAVYSCVLQRLRAVIFLPPPRVKTLHCLRLQHHVMQVAHAAAHNLVMQGTHVIIAPAAGICIQLCVT